MSFAILNGYKPTRNQLIQDSKLNELVAESGREEDRYHFGKLLFKSLRDQPQLINSVDGSTGRKMTNEEMLTRAVKTARALRAAGVGVGDVVMITGVSHLELTIPLHAAFFNGSLPINVNIGATAYELDNLIKVSRPKIIFSDAIKIDTLKEALSTSGVISTIISFSDVGLPDVDTFTEFTRPFSGDIASFKIPDRNRDDLALLLCTSGSTGLPKIPALTNYCLVAQVSNFGKCDRLNKLKPGTGKTLVVVTNQWLAFFTAVVGGAIFNVERIQTPLRPQPAHILQIVRKYKPHTVISSPGYMSQLMSDPTYRPGDLSSFITVYVTGAALSSHLLQKLKEAIHPSGEISNTYGCTEIGGFLLESISDRLHGSIGKNLNTLSYKIVDDNDKQVKIGQIGELLVKPKQQFFKGYYNNEEATKEILTEDGFFRTSDLVHRNEKGHYFYVDRKSLLITYNNYHIYPSELEGMVANIPGVLDVAVCASDSGPVGLVVKKQGHDLIEQDIQEVLKGKLSAYKQLVGGIFFLPALPRTVTGKVDQTKLKNIVSQLHKSN